jgi:pentatricopeptide repeat protein
LESPSSENRDHLGPGEREKTDSPDSSSPGGERRIFFQTKSLAEVYAKQGYVSIALEIYRRMQERDASDLQVAQRISELENGFRSRRSGKPKDQKGNED